MARGAKGGGIKNRPNRMRTMQRYLSHPHEYDLPCVPAPITVEWIKGDPTHPGREFVQARGRPHGHGLPDSDLYGTLYKKARAKVARHGDGGGKP